MYLKRLISRQTFNGLSRINGRLSGFNAIVPISTWASQSLNRYDSEPSQNPLCLKRSFGREIHSSPSRESNFAETEPRYDFDEDESAVNEFLSRFVWMMRGKVSEAYPDCDKQTINAMLQVIVEKVISEMENGGDVTVLAPAMASPPPQDFSEDLWKTVWEVSNVVLSDMKKEAKKEKMKKFLQCDEVKKMARFAMEVGVRGEILRELRYKWACEKMEEAEFHEGLECLKTEGEAQASNEQEAEGRGDDAGAEERQARSVSLPKRRGKIRYKIYGLDLSGAKWAEVADRVHEKGEVVWPQEEKPIAGKCKIVNEKIISLNEDEDPSPLLAEWAELLEPSRADWIALLDGLKEKSARLYLKVAELLLSEKSLQANVHDYSNLIDAYAKQNRLEDAERIIVKMNENGIVADLLTAKSLVHMYSKAGNLDRAKEAFESLITHGFRPDSKLYNTMIMAYVNAGLPNAGETLMKDMKKGDGGPTIEIYMALLRAFARIGDIRGAERIFTTMQSAGLAESFEPCKLIIEAYAKAGNPDRARNNFDHMLKLGHMPDDECVASMIAAYEKVNLLDKALHLFLQLEKDGFQPGVATYTALVDWLGKLQLIEEAEQLLGKISEQGEAPSYKLHVSLCDMYSRAKVENKTLKALGVLESKKEELGPDEFVRIILALKDGGFMKQALRMLDLMQTRGFTVPKDLQVNLRAYQAFGQKRP